MTESGENPPIRPPSTAPDSTDPGLVAILAYDGLCTFEFGIAVEVFALPRPEFTFPWYRCQVVGLDGGPCRATGGITVSVDCGLDGLEMARTVIVPGWRSPSEAPPPALCDALRRAHARGARLLSICSGVYVLAATGLLNGLRATTHWHYGRDLAERYPDITVEDGVLYVDNGSLITSAGSAAGLDACLYLVARDFGASVAAQVARRLVMTPHRSGGQKQFIAHPMPTANRADMAALMDWARERLDQPLTVGSLARQAGLSERTLQRHFTAATGMAPRDWIRQERLALARLLLESTTLTPDQISHRCGYASPETFRTAFRGETGLPPGRYRQRFGPRPVPQVSSP